MSLAIQEIGIILLVELIDDMKMSNQLLDDKFEASPERVFELPRIKKVLNLG